ncbi:terpene cyclase/mutase family protein [soil metagenome]
MRSSSFQRLTAAVLLASQLAIVPVMAIDKSPLIKPPDVADVVIDARTESAIKGALKFLAGNQSPSGAWSENEHPVAFTGYVLMAFLATGNLPGEGEYSKTVSRGMQYLLDCVGPDGYISSAGATAGKKDSNMYDHGIASIVLGEIYGQTKDPVVHAKLKAVIKLTLSAQDKSGGWRYQPRPQGSDISVTVLQVVALRCAKNAGLDVPQETIEKAVAYVKSCHDEATGGFDYQPKQKPGFARTCAAIYSLQVCGKYDDPMILPASKYMDQFKESKEWFTYGHFYAAPAKYMIGGQTWKDWYGWINNLLLKNVKRNGDQCSWAPIDGKLGEIYATAVYTMILAMPYHYIPLYQR